MFSVIAAAVSHNHLQMRREFRHNLQARPHRDRYIPYRCRPCYMAFQFKVARIDRFLL